MDTPVYRERVLPSLATFLLAPLLGVFVFAVMLPVNDQLGTLIAISVSALLASLLILKAPVIEVSISHVRVGRARIDRALIGSITIVSAEDAFAEKGHLLDATAYTSFQASVKTMLKVQIADKADPTPYWLFSTRNPEKLKDLLS